MKAMQEAEEARKAAEVNEGDVVENHVLAQQAEERADEAVKDAERVAKSRTSVKGDFSARASYLRTSWYAEITDCDKALEHYRNHPKVREVIQSLASADARSPEKRNGPAIPGVEFQSQQTAA